MIYFVLEGGKYENKIFVEKIQKNLLESILIKISMCSIWDNKYMLQKKEVFLFFEQSKNKYANMYHISKQLFSMAEVKKFI